MVALHIQYPGDWQELFLVFFGGFLVMMVVFTPTAIIIPVVIAAAIPIPPAITPSPTASFPAIFIFCTRQGNLIDRMRGLPLILPPLILVIFLAGALG